MSYYLRCLNERPALYKDDALVHKQVQHMLLLAYLERQGKQSRLHVANIFWPHFDKEKRLKYLSEALRLIEKAAPRAVQKEDSNGQHLWVELSSDVKRLQQAIADENYAFVLDLPTFHYLPQLEYNQRLNIEDKALLHDWLIAEREAVSNMAQEALLKLAEHYAAQEHYQPVASLARRAYKLRKTLPLLLPVTYQRIYQLLRASDDIFYITVAQEALAAYGQQAITGWVQSQQEARQALASPYKLPYVAHKVVGRDDDIAECIAVLKARTRLLTIHGTAGMGKTYMGLALARRLRGYSFAEDGVFWLELETIHTATDLLLELATILNANISSNQQAHEAIIRSISERKIVLVLDNFEHLVSTRTLLSQLLAACPHLRLVVTSRIIVGNSWEYIYRIKGLAYLSQEEDKLQGEQVAIQNYAAAQLFLQQAEQKLGRLHLDAAQQSAVLRICQQVQGMPLGLCLAASWLGSMTLEAISQELEHSPLLLQGEASQDKARHKNMHYAFEVSWRLLSLAEQSLYRKLSVFVGGFSLSIAQQIADASVAALKKLQEKALLSWNSMVERYHLHPLLRQFALEKLEQSPHKQQWQEKYHHYFSQQLLVVTCGTPIERNHAPQRLALELPNIAKAWQWQLEQANYEFLDKGAHALEQLYDLLGQASVGKTLLQRAEQKLAQRLEIEPANSSQQRAYVNILASLAWLCKQSAQYKEAATLAERARELAQSWQHERALSTALNTLGAVYDMCGQFSKARKYVVESLQLKKGGSSGYANVLSNLAQIDMQLGGYQSAQQRLRQALAIFERKKRYLKIVQCHFKLARLAFLQQENATQIQEKFYEVARLAQQHHVYVWRDRCYFYQGYLACLEQNYELAKDYSYKLSKLAQASLPRKLEKLLLDIKIQLQYPSHAISISPLLQQALKLAKNTHNLISLFHVLALKLEYYQQQQHNTQHLDRFLLLNQERIPHYIQEEIYAG